MILVIREKAHSFICFFFFNLVLFKMMFCEETNLKRNWIYGIFLWCMYLLLFPIFNSVQFSRVRLFVTPWTVARQVSLSITNSQSPPKPMSIESVMPSSHLTPCRPLLLLPSIFPSIRVFLKWVSFPHQVAKVLEFQLEHQSFQWTPRTDLL